MAKSIKCYYYLGVKVFYETNKRFSFVLSDNIVGVGFTRPNNGQFKDGDKVSVYYYVADNGYNTGLTAFHDWETL